MFQLWCLEVIYKIFVALFDDSFPTLSPSMSPPRTNQLEGSPMQQRIVSSSSSPHKGTECSKWCMRVYRFITNVLNFELLCNKSTAGYVLLLYSLSPDHFNDYMILTNPTFNVMCVWLREKIKFTSHSFNSERICTINVISQHYILI